MGKCDITADFLPLFCPFNNKMDFRVANKAKFCLILGTYCFLHAQKEPKKVLHTQKLDKTIKPSENPKKISCSGKRQNNPTWLKRGIFH